jgi:hypothetical protein
LELLLQCIIDNISHHIFMQSMATRPAFSIADLKLIEGSLPNRVISLVLEWAFEHRDDLMKDWELAMAKKPLNKITPLV